MPQKYTPEIRYNTLYVYTPTHRYHPSTTSISSSVTISNLTGPGRSLGTVFSRVGLSLERAIGRFTHRVGFGPRAIRKQIGKKMSRHSTTIFPWNLRESTQLNLSYDDATEEILRLCKELDAYTRSEIDKMKVWSQKHVLDLLVDFPSLRPLFRRGMNVDNGCLDNNAHISLVLLFPIIERMDEDMKLDIVLLSCLGRELYDLEGHPNYIGYGREQQIMLALLDYVYEGGENAFTALEYLLEWLETPRENDDTPMVLNYTVCQKFFHACGILAEWNASVFERYKCRLLRRTVLSLEKLASTWESLWTELTTCSKRLRKAIKKGKSQVPNPGGTSDASTLSGAHHRTPIHSAEKDGTLDSIESKESGSVDSGTTLCDTQTKIPLTSINDEPKDLYEPLLH